LKLPVTAQSAAVLTERYVAPGYHEP